MQTSQTPKQRCFGNKPGQQLLAAYHDTEWGVWSEDERYLFEMLALEGAQAGLNWETVLKKRANYRKAFYNFDVHKVAAMDDAALQHLLQNPGLIRNRLKIQSVRQNARVFLAIQQEYGAFASYLKSFVKEAPRIGRWQKLADVPTTSPESCALSKDLKKRGMRFVGPTIVYAYMQAVGLVCDHLQACWRAPKAKGK
ncbi:MAG: DNA-3-methyladenine glycosylase I [Holosporaceae bacterium]